MGALSGLAIAREFLSHSLIAHLILISRLIVIHSFDPRVV